jgi:hypothetical protein
MKLCRSRKRIYTLIMLVVLVFGSEMAAAGIEHLDARSGELNILTYNVKGLLPLFSTDGRGNQKENNRLISPLLNNYSLVLVQEDFFYHDALSAETTHAYQSGPTGPFCIKFFFAKLCILPGDGLARFSEFAFEEPIREQWEDCNGGLLDPSAATDCLAKKGFSLAEMELAPGVFVDVYNLHMDAGPTDGDFRARANQVEQLIDAINGFSFAKALIVVGDTNLHLQTVPSDDQLPTNAEILERLIDGAQLTDACRAVGCDHEQIDRIFYRSGEALKLEAVDWTVDERFVDADGEPLSDHSAIAVQFVWQFEPEANLDSAIEQEQQE